MASTDLVDVIAFWAKINPRRPAIIQPDLILTYSAFADSVHFVSRRISELNLDRNEPVAVSIESPARQLVACFALLHAGYSAAPINQGTLPHLRKAGINNVLYDKDGQVLSGGRNIRFDDRWLTARPSSSDAARPIGADAASDLQTIFFTSGSTGLPKKIVQSSEALAERLNIGALIGNNMFERVLIVPGLSSHFGFNRACDVLRGGKTACFAGFGEPMLVLIATYQIDVMVASAQQAHALVEMIEAGTHYPLESLKSVRIGGAFASKELVARVQSRLCRNVTVEYGSTEAGLIALAPYESIAEVPEAVGFVAPWVELEIVDDDNNVLPPDTVGKIRCRTPLFSRSIRANYPELPADSHDIWWYPGDVGRLTRNRILCVAGRSDDIINQGGAKVSSGIVENALLRYPEVKDAGVCGMPGAGGMTQIWIGVVPRTSIDPVDLRKRLEADQSFPAMVDEIFVVEQIPRNALGKLQAGDLKELLLARKAAARKS
jgi:acyl-coenzyme A synthetase/AMP-(fatty) acid ligase